MDKLPTYSTDLVELLEQEVAAPKVGTNVPLDIPERELWFRSGQRSIVEYLLSLLEQSKQNILETP